MVDERCKLADLSSQFRALFAQLFHDSSAWHPFATPLPLPFMQFAQYARVVAVKRGTRDARKFTQRC